MISIDEIKRRYSIEMAMVVLVVRVYLRKAGKKEIVAFISSHNIDWAFFYRLIASHQIRPVVFKVLNEDISEVDGAFLTRLRMDTIKIAADNLARANELKRLIGLFKKNQIKAVPYKGAMLSSLIFDDLVSRETCDIDLFISAEDFAKVTDILQGEGYQFKHYHDPNFERQLLRSECECTLHRVDSFKRELKIELHWRVVHKMMDVPFDVSEVLANTSSAVLLDEKIEIIHPQVHMLLMLIHHGVNDVWRSLRHLVDIGVLIESKDSLVDWAKLKLDLDKNRVSQITTAGFMLCSEVLGVEPTFSQSTVERKIPALLGNLLQFPMLKRDKLSKENFLQHMVLRDNYWHRVRLIVSYFRAALTPNMRDVEAVTLHSRFRILYYFVKPYRLLRARV